MFLKRAAIIAATALLTACVLTPPAQAAPGYLCLIATATQTGDTYALSHTTCTGTGIHDVPVLVFSGPAAGSYVCHHVLYYPLSGKLQGSGCVRT